MIQDQIPGELGQARHVESIMDRLVEQVGQTPTKYVMLGLMCLEMRVSELAQDALLGFEVLVNQRGQVVQQRDEVAFVHAVRTPEKPVAEQQQPFVLCIQNGVTDTQCGGPSRLGRHDLRSKY